MDNYSEVGTNSVVLFVSIHPMLVDVNIRLYYAITVSPAS